MIIDIFTHIYPPGYFDALAKFTRISPRMTAIPALSDLDARFRDMDVLEDYRQVIALPHPVAEEVTSTPGDAAELCRLGNDALAALSAAHPDRFPAWVAGVSMLDIEAAVAEIDRAVGMGARGIQVYTNILGRPLDEPAFDPVFAAMARHDLPIWLHPARTAEMTDYAAESRSRYEMWWCYGWPYETTVALSRLVLSGIYDRYPGLKIIAHHYGGMIPFSDGRMGPGMDFLGSRTPDEDYSQVLSSLKRPHLDYFRDIYADTALFGGRSGLHAGLDFFGVGQTVFGTDAPFAPIRETYDALDSLNLSPTDRDRILSGNAMRLLKL
ncbi:MAG: amidohydrolase [Rhodobacteraceae bacterium]|nr:amidohydrolase [Paracoccaceae bacterium]MBR9821029.1 amidohydrolase [Paracoccaceae bacterium]